MPLRMDPRVKDSLNKLLQVFYPFGLREVLGVVSAIRKSQIDVDKQVSEAADSLRNASLLVASLQKSVEDQMSKVQKLREEYDRYSKLAQVEMAKAEPIIRQVESAIGKEQSRERLIALAMHLGVGFLFFVVGVLAGDSFKHWIVEHLWTIH